MSEFKTETLSEQNQRLGTIESPSGEIILSPRWVKDYTAIIKANFKVAPMPKFALTDLRVTGDSLHEARATLESWKSVKLSWENAAKFVESACSRGIVPTVVDIIGLDKNRGNRIAEDTHAQRQLSCFGNPSRGVKACFRLQTVEGKGQFCGSCGCGDNKLAKLDGEGYTKLHYPHLECPLRRKGFSNAESRTLSIVIPALNEAPDILQQTIQSIRDTAGGDPEIIVVDDCSDTPVVTTERLIRNPVRLGTGRSRHLGAEVAAHDTLLFLDAHMTFAPGWYENVLQHISSSSNTTAYCGVCVGLNEQNRDISAAKGRYYGAKLVLYDESKKTILEGKWIPEVKDKDRYELSCMMGALYFVPKQMYFKVRGFSDLKMWGSLEPCLSTKIWLAGGEIRLLKDVRAGHIFRSTPPYKTDHKFLLYNKIRLAKTLLPREIGELLISKLPQSPSLLAAQELVASDGAEIDEYARYYAATFSRDIYWLAHKFNLSLPS
jgi:glycosyltransferase involved in cell wall biosynthesis